MDNKRGFPLLLSSFWLKIIAILTMTVDHVGVMFDITPCRYIGRLALPLFCFMAAEGVLHTKNFKKYALRLGIMASVISLIIVATETIPFLADLHLGLRYEGIIFLDLLLGVLAVYCLMNKRWYIKLLAILPLAYGIASFIATTFDDCGCYGEVLWFPYFLRTQYEWFGIALVIGFYLAHLLVRLFFKFQSNTSGIDADTYKGTRTEQIAINIVSALILAALTLLYYLVNNIMSQYISVRVIYSVQLISIISGAFILLYSGARGYNKKWFQYGSYLYYPLHLAIIAAIAAIVFSI
ncbi:MAG: hypothetical protein J6I84_06365 [Bacilli bacterium]|nr:hypothetical protein [Bacilli bacterium]